MAIVKRNAIVPHSALEMYHLVDNIEDYPQFLPWCKSSQVMTRSEDEVKASITLAKSGIQKTFSTCNRLQAGKMIEIRLLDGPFKHLEGFWKFEGLDDRASRISLDMEFEFSNRLMSVAISPVFTQICNSLVDSFCKRAREVYS